MNQRDLVMLMLPLTDKIEAVELEERFKDFFVGNYDALYRQAYGLVK